MFVPYKSPNNILNYRNMAMKRAFRSATASALVTIIEWRPPKIAKSRDFSIIHPTNMVLLLKIRLFLPIKLNTFPKRRLLCKVTLYCAKFSRINSLNVQKDRKCLLINK